MKHLTDTECLSAFFKIVKKTYEYMSSNSLSTMVLGVSGGIDSTVCAAICYEVEKLSEGKIRLICVSLPCSSNADEENESAIDTMNAFSREEDHWIENLEKEYRFFKSTCESHVKSTEISQGNIKARLRMTYLYNVASVTNGIVIDTDNLTEHYLGFFTLHGDQGDFNPIGGLWKNEIYDLAKYLKRFYWPNHRDMSRAIGKSVELTPTDGNGVKAGGDLAQIAPGLTYYDVDEVLQRYLEIKHLYGPVDPKQGYAIHELDDLYEKYGKDIVDGIIKRHLNSEFKRKKMPIVIERSMLEIKED